MTTAYQRIFYFAVGGLVTLVALYYVAFRPIDRHINETDAQVAQTQNQLAEYNRIVKELPSILDAEHQLQVERLTLNSSLYAKEDVLSLFQQLSQDAAEYNLKLVQITPPISELLELNRQAAVENNPLFLDITLDFEGQYLRFGQYVSDLETEPYFRAIRSCRMRSQPSAPFVDLSLSFKALLGTTEATKS